MTTTMVAKTHTSPLNLFVTGTVGISQSINPTLQRYSPEDICLYDYQARSTNSPFSRGGAIGVEITLPYSYLYAIDIGVNYYQSGSNRINGIKPGH